jgi:CheY-like chemotaxis protein
MNEAGARGEPSAPPILIVDDYPEGARRTSAILAGRGFPLVIESRGAEVLPLVRATALRLVVAELYIPATDGRCVVEALKEERARLPRLRVLIYTRHASPADTAWALDAGADAVVPKPASASILLREIGRLLGEHVA